MAILFYFKLRNIFGSTRHGPRAVFRKHANFFNRGRDLNLMQPSECRMAGEHIGLLRLLCLKNALRSTIMSKEWMDLRIFYTDCVILMNPEFWKLLFVMCRALYAPMRVLCLSDQKTPAMDKLYYYVLQTDRMLPKYLDDAEKLSKKFLTSDNVFIMDRPSTAGLTSLTNDDNDGEDDDDDDYDIEAEDVVGGGEEEVDSDDDDR